MKHLPACFVLFFSLLSSAKVYPFPIQDSQNYNDSIYYYTERGNTPKARYWIDQALRATGDETERARTFLLMGNLENNEGYAMKAIEYFRQCLSSKKIIPSLHASAYAGMASALAASSRHDSVEYFLQKSLSLDSSMLNQVACHLAAARNWQNQNQQERSLPEWQRAYEKAKVINNRKLMGTALAGMASLLFSQEPDMNKILEYLLNSNALLDSAFSANIMAQNYARMANAYMVMSNLTQAEKFLIRAKTITDLSGNLPVTSYVLASWAILKSEQGDIAAAIRFAEEPIRIRKKLGLLKQLQNDLLNLSEYYTLQKRYDKTREILQEGIALSTKLGDVIFLHYYFEHMAALDSITGNYRTAYSNLRKSDIYKDSALSLKRFRAVEDIREQYEAEQKEKIIAEKELELQQHRYQRSIIISASMIAILIFIVVLIISRNRHRNKMQAEEQRQHHLRLQSIVQTQEEVQQSIARDIHDGLVQVLGAAKMSLQSVTLNGDKRATLQRIKDASRIMDEACTEARNISHQILPYSLVKDGLVPAVEELLKKSFHQYTLIKPDTYLRLDSNLEINVYRIAQELVNNIVKHAHATEVQVTLYMQNGHLGLTFRDNGKGFEKDVPQGAGLTNIVTRTELINGMIDIQSQPGAGTTVKLSVPL